MPQSRSPNVIVVVTTEDDLLALLNGGKLVELAGRCIEMPTGLSAHFANCASLVPRRCSHDRMPR